ncbi:hypothetical protein GCM10010873_04590 [Cypionkella aquatica]|uniref:Alpha/beta hydrolase n=1 Tax=Cypionkella aquatica TaxID=1756042 RepID=A0AA37TYG0_9RHOB|nr:alpha/beta hydrolase [Cypionkella aquatica]GLS85486.1 hypothetical protein GCM10010873_04590 [Cypionkella aquatica]
MLKRLISRRSFLQAGSGAMLAACATPIKLAEPPTLYRVGATFPQADVPAALRTVAPEIFYVTDRAPLMQAGQLAGYSHKRSSSMAFGAARVRFGNIASWAELVSRSEAGARQRQVMTAESYREIVRFPATPLPFVQGASGRIVAEPAALARYGADVATLQAGFRAALRGAARKEALIFVHGFNNEMDDGLTTTASLWHYAGRIGVPVSYSWPAGNKGLTAYFKDRESGEFSTYHLKEFLRALAAIPELEKINIVAHSRGADVLASALREMVIFEMGAGRDARRSLKIDTLILAAPDLDFGVVQQRLAAEGTAAAVRQITVYLNPRDGALGLAQALATGQRVGRLSPDKLTESDWTQLNELRNVYFIDVENAGNKLGHAYFRDNPAVLSDVILTLRTGALPGGTDRPLEQIRGNFWRMHANYPGPRVVVELKRNSGQ